MYDLGVELSARVAGDLDERRVAGHCVAVRPAGGHRVIRIDDREDARTQGNLFADKAAWVACTVKVFVVSVDDLGRVLEEVDAL